MKKFFLKHIYWIIPIIIIFIGIGILFRDSYLQVAEPPSSNWSDALYINTTTTKNIHNVNQKKRNTLVIPHIKEDKVILSQYNNDFSFLKENEYAAKADKGLKFYEKDDAFYYFSKHTIYDNNHTKLHGNVDDFYPLSDKILFRKADSLFTFNPKKEKTTNVLSLDKEHNIIIDSNLAPYVLIYKVNHQNELAIDIYQLKDKETNLLTTSTFPMKQGQKIHDISFAIKKEQIALSLQTKPKDVLGTHDFSTYFFTAPWSDMDSEKLSIAKLDDPASDQSLSEISNIVPRFIEGEAHFLFQAIGYTETSVRNVHGFNIYDVILSNTNKVNVKRKSNTPRASLRPIWIDDDSIAWLEPNKDKYDIYGASNNDKVISKASVFNKDFFIGALGKTIMGLVTAGLMVLPALIWLIWPFLFIFLLHVFWGRFLDQQQPWIYYTGISVYLVSAFIFQNIVFTETIYLNAPHYLAFDGSSYFYISLFAFISFISIRFTSHFDEWDVTFKILYFACVHLIMIITFFGPYLI